MDVFTSDADFDSYWEEEARNPNRNRIRIGRQYQATVPPLLKPGENDGRNLEDLETLKWKPENVLSDQDLNQYLSLAKAVTVFAKAITSSNSNQNSDSNSVNNSKNCESDSNSHSDISNSNSTKTENHSGEDRDSNSKEDKKDKENSDSANPLTSEELQLAWKGLSDFIASHHPSHSDVECKVPISSSEKAGVGSQNINSENITSIINWTSDEINLFAKALVACGKNFSAIKKDFLPWKPVKSIINYYYGESNKTKSNEKSPSIKTCGLDSIMSERKSNELSSDETSANSSVASSSSKSPLRALNYDDLHHKKLINGVDEVDRSTNSKHKNDIETDKNNAEITVSRAKPLTSSVDVNSSVSNLGSLKFYMDGQLVLKLNAKQEVTGRKCQWVESQDTPKFTRPIRKGNKKLLLERADADTKLGHVHNDRCMHQTSDDGEECSLESSDEDSMGSTESAALTLSTAVTARKARVKVENNCLIPLPSPNRLSGTKDRSNSIRKSPSPVIHREPLCSPSQSPFGKAEESKRKLKIPPWPPDPSKSPSVGRMEMKWNSFGEKELHPPVAHAASRICNNSHYDSMSYSAAPVDLTRKSALSSPHAKSPCLLSSPPTSTCSNSENGRPRSHSPSPNKSNYPISLTSNSVSQRQSKSGKDTISNDLCQKDSTGKLVKLDRENRTLSISNPAVFASFQNPLVSYFPFQYYDFNCRYGLPQLGNTAL